MAFDVLPITPYGYNANPPPDDGSRQSANRVSWLKIRSSLTDPLRFWLDAINYEIARTFSETSEFYVLVGSYQQVSWSGPAVGYAGLNAILSTTDYARLAAAIQGYFTYADYTVGAQFLTPPYNYYPRPAGVYPVGTVQADQNKSHTHGVTDPGHLHTVGTLSEYAGNQSLGGTRASNPIADQSSGAATTGITIDADGEDEARPKTMVLQGMVKA